MNSGTDVDAHRQENAAERRDQLNTLTGVVIGCAQRVSSALGSGFLEKVYENALAVELRQAGLLVEQQRPVVVRYQGQVVGEFVADILVDGCLLLELKAADNLGEAHHAQCLNYLKATDLTLALLLNFGTPRLQVRRIVNGF